MILDIRIIDLEEGEQGGCEKSILQGGIFCAWCNLSILLKPYPMRPTNSRNLTNHAYQDQK